MVTSGLQANGGPNGEPVLGHASANYTGHDMSDVSTPTCVVDGPRVEHLANVEPTDAQAKWKHDFPSSDSCCTWQVAAQPGRGWFGLTPFVPKTFLGSGLCNRSLCPEAALYPEACQQLKAGEGGRTAKHSRSRKLGRDAVWELKNICE